MKLGQTLQIEVMTPAGPVTATVNLISAGSEGGSNDAPLTVIRELRDAVKTFPRAGKWVVSPVVEVPFDSVETAALDAEFDGGGQG